MSRPERMTRWFIFGVLSSLFPLCLGYVGLRLDGGTPTLISVLGQGELLLICTVITAAGVGELLTADRKYPVRKLIVGGACVIIGLFAASCFAMVKSRAHPDLGTIQTISLWLFAGTLLAGGSCVSLAHEEKTS
jgi:hypothetical protein